MKEKKINQFHEDIQFMAICNQIEADLKSNDKIVLSSVPENFSWWSSPQGYDFWSKVYTNDYTLEDATTHLPEFIKD